MSGLCHDCGTQIDEDELTLCDQKINMAVFDLVTSLREVDSEPGIDTDGNHVYCAKIGFKESMSLVNTFISDVIKSERERCESEWLGAIIDTVDLDTGLKVRGLVNNRRAIISKDNESNYCAWTFDKYTSAYRSECGFRFAECIHDREGVDICPQCLKPIKESTDAKD